MRTLKLFSARWCGKCHAADKRIKKVIDSKKYDFIYEHIEIEVDKDSVKKYNVEGFPTLIAFENNQETNRLSGTILPDKIIEFLE